jgi:deoxyribodipyrimidine photo-lyase
VRTAIVLFTRDLRVHDQSALTAAVEAAERVVPLFVLDRAVLARFGAPNRVAFLLDSLHDLAASLRARGGGLVVREGDVVAETMRVANQAGAEAIFVGEDVSGYAQRREVRLRAACAARRLELRVFPGVTVVPPGELAPAGSDHFRVFTPYWRRWRAEPRRPVGRAPRRVALPPRVRRGRLPALADLVAGMPSPELPRGGETEGRRRLSRWLARSAERYGERHDDLAADGTSRLSPFLHFGCLSPTELAARAGDAEPFLRQLAWRDFYAQLLASNPASANEDLRPGRRRWRDEPGALDAWREGRTGYPVVDAGMRQLRREGWMHNRARLLTASFLTKDLGLDWRLGAGHFFEWLVDGDVANNVGNWQWVAGTGVDTRPNRRFNPIRQARRFDPDGDYVRRYVPELAGIEGRAVHEPWKLGGARPPSYPERIVDR